MQPTIWSVVPIQLFLKKPRGTTGREIGVPTMAGIQLLYIFNTGGNGLAKGHIKDEVLT